MKKLAIVGVIITLALAVTGTAAGVVSITWNAAATTQGPMVDKDRDGSVDFGSDYLPFRGTLALAATNLPQPELPGVAGEHIAAGRFSGRLMPIADGSYRMLVRVDVEAGMLGFLTQFRPSEAGPGVILDAGVDGSHVGGRLPRENGMEGHVVFLNGFPDLSALQFILGPPPVST